MHYIDVWCIGVAMAAVRRDSPQPGQAGESFLLTGSILGCLHETHHDDYSQIGGCSAMRCAFEASWSSAFPELMLTCGQFLEIPEEAPACECSLPGMTLQH